VTTLDNRPNTALLVTDVQTGFVKDAYDRDAIVGNVSTVVDKARAAGVDLIWVQHHNDDQPQGSGAIVRGYDAILVSDAHTTEDLSEYGAPPPDLVIAHTNLYWEYHTAPGRTAGTVTTADLDFTAPVTSTAPRASCATCKRRS